MSRGLPVFSTLLGGLHEMTRHSRRILPMAGLVLALQVGTVVLRVEVLEKSWFAALQPHARWPVGAAAAVLLVLAYALLVPLVASLQRLVIEGPEARVGLAFRRTEWLVLRGWAVVILVSALVYLGVGAVGVALLGIGKLFAALPGVLAGTVIANLTLWLGATLYLARFSLILPAAAVGRVMRLKESAELAGRHLWSYLALAVLAVLPFNLAGAGLGFVLARRAHFPAAGECLGLAFSLAGGLFAGAVVALVYRRLAGLGEPAAPDLAAAPARAGRWRPSRAGLAGLAAALLLNAAIVHLLGGPAAVMDRLSELLAAGSPTPAAQPAPAAPAAPTAADLQRLRTQAELGDPDSQFRLGWILEHGAFGTAKDEAQAAEFYRRAAERGYAPAVEQLGTLVQDGRGGLQKDEGRALALFRQAAERGYPKAMYDVGLMYDHGLGGLARDSAQALAWYRKAAGAGYRPAQDYLKALGGGAKIGSTDEQDEHR